MKYKKYFEIKFLMSYLDCEKDQPDNGDNRVCDDDGVPLE